MTQTPSRSLPFPLLAALYAVSGALGLAYEVVFSKHLSLVFGATAYAASAVLVAYMGGLAAGAWLAGRSRWLSRYPLAAYGLAEIVVGSACIVVTIAFPLLPVVYTRFAAFAPSAGWLLHGARALLAALAVFVPTIAMGSTLPLLASALRGEQGKRRLSWLYACNTLGGAGGALACAYLVLPSFGLAATMRGAAAISFAVGALAIAAGRVPQDHQHSSPNGRAPRAPGLEALAFCSGLFVFVAEVVYVHLLALVIGTSAYAFGLMIAIFLTCLGAGASIAARWLTRSPSALLLSLAATGMLILASLPLWDRTPAVFESVGPLVLSWQGRELVRATVALCLLGLPVVAMGAAFPLVLHAAGGADTARAQIGRLSAFNTVGAIAGSLLGGFVLLPAFGSERCLAIVAAAYLLTACLGWRRLPPRARTALAVMSACAVLIAVVRPRWDLFRLTSGANVYFEPSEKPEQIVMIREDVHGGVTTVTRDSGVLTLLTNGKFQGNDSHEIQAQRGFGHLSAIHAPRSDSALVIGLGTGTTAGVLAAHGFGRIDVAEISPAITEAARTWFGHINGAALQNPRVHVQAEDGRNLLLMNPHAYDLVAIEITSIWFAGAANLYNEEFYRLAMRRLSPGGILQQWVQLHHMPRRVLTSILATLRKVFPHVVVYVRGNQGIIIASASPARVSRTRLAQLQSRPESREMLGPDESLEGIVSDAVLVDESLDRFLSEAAKAENVPLDSLVSTDDNLLLEYASPRANVPGLPDIIATSWLMRPYRPADIVSRILEP